MHRIGMGVLLLWLWVAACPALANSAQPTNDIQPSTNAQSAGSSGSSPAPAVMEVRYFDRGAKDARHAYKFHLIQEILEITRPEYGDFRIYSFADEASAKRQALLISEGRVLNLTWASPGTVIARAEVIAIPVDILQGLLGFRVCLINPDNYPAQVNSLHQLDIGQGLNWSDVEIYRYNQINVREAPSFEALFTMLAAKRFQCLPLGADEVVFTWREKKLDYPFLTIEPNLLLYYDHPVHLQVSKKHPELARRLALGLGKLQRSGRFQQLFSSYHRRDLELLALHQRRLICLLTPYLPSAGQCTQVPPVPATHP